MTQPSLDFTLSAPEPRQPRKRVRQVSREAYRQRRALDVQREAEGKETAEGKVLRCMAAQFNRSQVWLTDRELVRWMVSVGELTSTDPNQIRPRRTALFDAGLVEPLPRRTCSVSGKSAHPWRVVSR